MKKTERTTGGTVGEKLIQSLKEAAAYARGEPVDVRINDVDGGRIVRTYRPVTEKPAPKKYKRD